MPAPPKPSAASDRRGRRALAELKLVRDAMEAGSNAGDVVLAPAAKAPVVVEDSPEPERVKSTTTEDKGSQDTPAASSSDPQGSRSSPDGEVGEETKKKKKKNNGK